MTLELEPMPSANRPGAACDIAATVWANSAGPRVNTGMMAGASRRVGAHTDASTSGVNPSAPSASADHASV